MTTSASDAPSSVYDACFQAGGLSQTHRRLLELIPARSTVLELGTSTGYLARVLAERGCTVDGIELNPDDARRAARHCRSMVVGSAEDPASYASLRGPYDVALMADVLEHLRSPEVALRAIATRLRAGGRIIVSLPNVAHWSLRVSLLRGRFEYTDTGLLDRTHLRFYTLATAKQLFAAAGYRVDAVIIPPADRHPLWRAKNWVKQTFPSLLAWQLVYVAEVR